jgi:hypothetical protein
LARSRGAHRFRTVRQTPLLLILAAAVLAPAATAQATFVVSAEDPAGDSADSNPARDLVRIAFEYNRRTGAIKGGSLLAGQPVRETGADLSIFAGTTEDGVCGGFPAIGFSTATHLTGVNWVKLSGPGTAEDSGTANKVYEGAAEDYEAFPRELAGQRPDCVSAQLSEPGNPSVVYDTAGPFRLTALPELEATFGDVPFLNAGGKGKSFRIVLRNVGDAGSGRVKLRLDPQRGLKIKLPKAVKSLKAGERRRIRVTISASKRAKSSTPLYFTATGRDGIRAVDDDYVLVTSGSSGGSKGGGGKTKLCNRYTWTPPYSRLVPC